MSSAFHPQTDGQSEVVNKIIVMYLCCLAGDRPKSWLQWLAWAEFCYNSSYQTALKCSPFRVVYGQDPPTLRSYEPGTAKVVAVDRQLQDRDLFLEQFRERLIQSQVSMKQQQDKSRREMQFDVGQWVWLRLQQRTTVGITTASPSKLGPKFYGPYQVVQRIGEVSYKLKLTARAKIHDVFHVSLLKKFEGAPPDDEVPLPNILHGKVLPEPANILKARLNRGVWELLVQWVDRPASDASCEQIENFKVNYPHVQLADELFVGEGGNVIDSFISK
jgi:hypothetical protein